MPYQSIQDLPPTLQRSLPVHGQEIFRAAFNSAWQQYGGDEAMAHRVAWAAVKRTYRKWGGVWVLKPRGGD